VLDPLLECPLLFHQTLGRALYAFPHISHLLMPRIRCKHVAIQNAGTNTRLSKQEWSPSSSPDVAIGAGYAADSGVPRCRDPFFHLRGPS
jgi:hypothetical protein